MFLQSLKLFGFRNLRPQAIHFAANANVISGSNGQGKTSLLEAIYLLSHSKSFRTASLENLVRWKNGGDGSASSSVTISTGTTSDGEADAAEIPNGTNPYLSPDRQVFLESREHQGCHVEAEVLTLNGPVSIAFDIKARSRNVFINGKQAKGASSFFGQLTSVVFTPEELQLVRGQPVVRRQSMDRVLAMVDPLFVDTLVQFQRALKQRNAVLSRSASDRAMLGADLQIWDTLLSKHGRTIAEKRAQFISEIAPLVMDYYERLAQPLRREKLSLLYVSEFLADDGVLSEESLRSQYLQCHQKDFRYQRTTFGVHRDDVLYSLDVGHGPRLARVSASQGQVRSIALSFKFATIDFLLRNTGEAPVVLLDDVESELDRRRRSALYELLDRVKSQVFITATEPPDLPSSFVGNVQKFGIENGMVKIL